MDIEPRIKQFDSLVEKLSEELKTESFFLIIPAISQTNYTYCSGNYPREIVTRLLIETALSINDNEPLNQQFQIISNIIVNLLKNGHKSTIKKWMNDTSELINTYKKIPTNKIN